MRLALRTLFWLTLAVAVLIGWGIEHRSLAKRLEEAERKAFWHSPRSASPSHEALARRKRLSELRRLSDEDLLQTFATSPASYGDDQYSDHDLCLIEMARREMNADLQQAYDTLMANPPDDLFPDNTKLLTALRRSKHEPDPLKIHVELKHHGWNHIPQTAPILLASVENVDRCRETVRWDEGGDDRSGRRTRWRVHLYDEHGIRVPDCSFAYGPGGGLGTVGGGLVFGEKGEWKNWLDARWYVKPPPAGRYKLQVFHTPDWADIAAESDLTGLILIQSEPINVIVSRPPSIPPHVLYPAAALSAWHNPSVIAS